MTAPMTRRRVLLLGSVVVVAALAVAIWLTWPRPSAITQENVAKIKGGITRAEAEAILGGPARDESVGVWMILYEGPVPERIDLDQGDYWVGPDYGVWVEFRDDRVHRIRRGPVGYKELYGYLHKLRRWLPR